MPAIYTHYRFSQDVQEKIDTKIISYEQKYYKLFSQSFDNLFYYNFFLFQTNNRIQRLGKLGHSSNTNFYFKNIITYIIDNKLQDNLILKGYLFGSINHYVLDSTMHPYVYYKNGKYNKELKDTYKYNGLHTKFEFMLDAYFYNLDTKLDYKNFNIAHNLVKRFKFDTEIKKAIDHVFLKTFKEDNIGKYFEKSYHHENLLFKYIMCDKYGFKKFLLTLYDAILKNKAKAYRFNTTYIKVIDESIINLEGHYWCNPCDKNIKSNDTVLELYEKAVDKSCELINLANEVLNNNVNIEKFLLELGNNSYSTGLDVSKKNSMNYFEF